MSDPARWQRASVDVGETPPIFHSDTQMDVDKSFKISWYARRLGDVVPNAWQAARIVQEFVEKLKSSGNTDDDIHDRRSYLASALREHVTRVVENQAEQVFKQKLSAGEIRFSLELGQPNFRMTKKYEISMPASYSGLLRKDFQPMQLSLFEPVIDQQFDSNLERNFAQYLDEQRRPCNGGTRWPCVRAATTTSGAGSRTGSGRTSSPWAWNQRGSLTCWSSKQRANISEATTAPTISSAYWKRWKTPSTAEQ